MWHRKGGARVRGPSDAVFPQNAGWKIDDMQVTLQSLRVRCMTRAFAMRKFKAPASEKAWNDRRGKLLRWEQGWAITTFYATPRDQVTWLKFQHRTLYTPGHRSDVDGTCRACSERENQMHLIECGVIRAEFWDPLIDTCVTAGMARPAEVLDFLITGQLADLTPRMKKKEGMVGDYAGIVFIAFRCLYAEITASRVEEKPLSLQRALHRTLHERRVL